jgi:pimeloyl-ACP methyl ester carboxylesterase
VRPAGRIALAGLAVAAGAAAAGRAQSARVRRRAEGRFAPGEPTLPGGRLLEVTAADGNPVHAEVYGPEDAPTIVLAHGWVCSIRYWSAVIEELSKDSRVVAYDKRGHGRTPRPPSGDYSLEAQGEELGAVLRASLGPDRKAVVAGHSMGAMATVALAAEDPELLHRHAAALALISTGVGDLVSEALVLRTPDRFSAVNEKAGEAILRSRASLVLPEPLLLAGIRHVALTPGASSEAVVLTAELARECHPEARSGCGGSMSKMELHDALAAIEVPAVVVVGEDDRMTPPAHARRLCEELSGPAELVELPATGHMTPVEAPGRLSELLRDIVATHLAPARDGAAVAG